VSKQRDRGTKAETAVVNFLRTFGFGQHADRSPLRGVADTGDVDGLPGLVIEVKDQQRLNVPEWFRELEREVENATPAGTTPPIGVLWAKRKGFSSPSKWYAVMSGDDLALLLAWWFDDRNMRR